MKTMFRRWLFAFLVISFLLGFYIHDTLVISPTISGGIIPPTPTFLVSISGTIAPSATVSVAGERVHVGRIVDGDTIELTDGRKVRYIGINTPETADPRKPVECFGNEAKAENTRLVQNKDAILVKDISETDKYGRLLRYVYVEGVFVNEMLVRSGFAQVFSYPPDISRQDALLKAQQLAREEGLGLWSGCLISTTKPASTGLPTVTGHVLSEATSISDTSGCKIKGNISSSGEKIFHIPGCDAYDKTVINESVGERWFCNESDALASGWRKAKNCP